MWLQDNQACRSRPELFVEQEKMLGYATVGARNLEAAKKLYDQILGLVGMKRMFEHPSGAASTTRQTAGCSACSLPPMAAKQA